MLDEMRSAGRCSVRWICRWTALLIMFAASTVLSTSSDAAEQAKTLRAGAYAMDITPTKLPIGVNGNLQDKRMTQVHDRLHARCLVLDDGQTRIAIAICDSCMIPRDIFDEAKQIASKSTGIPTERMLTAATHTHTAPTATGVFQSEPDPDYRKLLVKRIAAGIEEAAKRLQPARIGWGVGKDPSQVFNRRWFMKPSTVNLDPFGGKTDQVRMNPGHGNPNLLKPSGPIDPDVSIVSIQTPGGKPIAVLANYSLHYVGGVPANSLSADYFGEFSNRIGQLIGATKPNSKFVGIMSNGTSANINNVNYGLKTREQRPPFEQIQYVSASVAAAANKAYQQIEYQDWVPLTMRERKIEVGVRLPNAKDIAHAKQILDEAGQPPYKTRPQLYARETMLMSKYPAKMKVKLQAIRIGRLAIVSSPCETFVETGLAIKQQSPFDTTFTIELANGYNGYLPTVEHHKVGGYETWRARSSYLAVDAEPKIRSTLLELLDEVNGAGK